MNAHTTPESARPSRVEPYTPGRNPAADVQFLRQRRTLELGRRRPRAMSALEAQFALHVRTAKLPEPEREYRFDGTRQWRFDFAWPTVKIAVECEGGIWTQGRHTRALGFEADCDKYNAATVQGWKVLRFTRSMIESGAAVETLIAAVRQAA
jgi:very-short-patch-repair endonuclease